MDYAAVLRILRLPDAAVHSVFRCGSRVYGTANEHSDEDFVAVLTKVDAGRDLVFRDGSNVITHGLASFREALVGQSVFALECLFAPAEHRLKEGKPGFVFKLDKTKLAASAISRSDSDFAKAGKRFEDESKPSKKKLFHALRVPTFALQIAREGRITDYGAATRFWREIDADPHEDWEHYRAIYSPIRDALTSELTLLTKKR